MKIESSAANIESMRDSYGDAAMQCNRNESPMKPNQLTEHAAMNAATPGPWRTGDADWRAIVGPKTRFFSPEYDKGETFLVGVATVDRSNDEAEDMANARLIAAAPELLAALKMAKQGLASAFDEVSINDNRELIAELDAALAAVMAAIAAAEGAK